LEFTAHPFTDYFRLLSSLGLNKKEATFKWNEDFMGDNHPISSNYRS